MPEFAERLVAYEATHNKSSETKTAAIFLVGEKLGPHLATFMGNVGFSANHVRPLGDRSKTTHSAIP